MNHRQGVCIEMQFIEEDLTNDEITTLKKVWRQFCRDSTRAQILTTMSDNREMGNIIYDVCHAELMERDRALERKQRTAESQEVWKAAPPKQQARMLKRRKLKPGVKSINF